MEKHHGKENLLIFAATPAHSSFVTILPREMFSEKRASLLQFISLQAQGEQGFGASAEPCSGTSTSVCMGSGTWCCV